MWSIVLLVSYDRYNRNDVPGNRCCPDVYSAKSLFTLYSTVRFIRPPTISISSIQELKTSSRKRRDIPIGFGNSK